MIRRITTGVAFLLWATMLCSQAQATHIQYVEIANIATTEANISYNASTPDTLSWTFDLLNDQMNLWEISTHYDSLNTTPDINAINYIGTGSYDDDYALHYVTLRIDPNKTGGILTSKYIKLEITTSETTVITDWSNPIRLYDWGVPDSSSILDPYGIGRCQVRCRFFMQLFV